MVVVADVINDEDGADSDGEGRDDNTLLITHSTRQHVCSGIDCA